ncbi:MAG: hypothetical protein K1060chlam4_00324 [Candidatus Anoxychlamydiales bacterium]|nr:hypothetical protein [Candidatus Anoxychlamydiales bacterium]
MKTINSFPHIMGNGYVQKKLLKAIVLNKLKELGRVGCMKMFIALLKIEVLTLNMIWLVKIQIF